MVVIVFWEGWIFMIPFHSHPFIHLYRTVAWWRHQMETFSALLSLCAGNSPVNSPHKGQWRGAFMFSLICARINGWVNNREAGDLRRYSCHYDVTVMVYEVEEAFPCRGISVIFAVCLSVSRVDVPSHEIDFGLDFKYVNVLCGA